MPYDAFLISKIVREIEFPSFLTGVHQGKRGTVIFSLKSQDVVVDVKSWPHLHVTSSTTISPENPTPFVSILRAKLKGAILTKVEQINFDRIVKFTFEVENLIGEFERYEVYHEVTGAFGNLIFTQNSKCVIAFKDVLSGKRTVARGATYIPPQDERKRIPHLSVNIFKNSSDKLYVFLMKNVRGLSKKGAIQVAKRAQLSFDTNVALLNNEERKMIIHVLQEIEEESKENKAYLFFENDIPVDVYAFKPVGKYKVFESASKAVETLLREKKVHDLFFEKKSEMKKILRKLILKTESTLDKIRRELLSLKGAEEFREYGELIMSQLYRLPKRSKYVEVMDWSSAKKVKIELDPKMSVLKNAQHFFDMYSKMKRKMEGTEKRLRIVEKRLTYFEELADEVENSTDINELLEIESELSTNGFLRKKKRRLKRLKESDPIEVKYKGFKILIGKNNMQNDRLTTKIASREDLWFHAREVPGAHVVIVRGGKEIPADVIEMAASLAAGHSRYKDSPWVDVDYTEIKNVSKPHGAKPGFVLYKKFKTVRVKPRR